MRILFVRHGDPDYEKDTLTEKGWREAALLAKRLSDMEIKAFYVSPLGRAKDTASLTLKKMDRTARECAWLKEFSPEIYKPNLPDQRSITWDWLPQDWTEEERFFHRTEWMELDVMQEGKVKEEVLWITGGLDKILEQHGYERNGQLYRVNTSNRDTIVFFCHFGVQCVLLSHLMNVSPMTLWHHLCMAPSSVTTLYSEERRKGIATFRAQSIGDLSHLYAGGEGPAFAARFCEIYDSKDRHD